MWEMINGITNGVRSRVMPRRRSGIGTMTAMVIGASVGIAAWEAVKRNTMSSSSMPNNDVADLADRVIENIQD